MDQRQLLAWRDEWDAYVAYLRRPDGPFPQKADLIEELLGGVRRISESWLQKELVPNAGWHATGTRDFGYQLGQIKKWIDKQTRKQRPGFELDVREQFLASFFTQAKGVVGRGFEFVGREAEIARIRRFFSEGAKVVSLTGSPHASGRRGGRIGVPTIRLRPEFRRGVAALRGFGGQGKTAIAERYAQCFAADYSGVLWVDSADLNLEAKIQHFVATHLADRIDPPEGNLHSRLASYFEQMAFVLRGRILIILDNIPYQGAEVDGKWRSLKRVDTILQGWLAAVPEPLVSRYDFLITSRREILTEKIVNMPIERLLPEDAAQLFLTRSARDDLDANDPQLLHLVNVVLGGHALSIALVASLAREQSIADLAILSAMVERKIVDAETLGELDLQREYPLSLYASLRASFEAIPAEARYLFLTLSLFRRDELTIEPLRRSVERMPDGEGEAIAAVRGEFLRTGGRYPALNSLVAYGLVERLNESESDDPSGPAPGTRATAYRPERDSRPLQIRLHEVVYDFAQTQWTRIANAPADASALHALEVALTRGACDYAAEQIEQGEIEFLDIETLVGFLLPIVHFARHIFPSPERVRVALSFWFEYFKIQNFIYDTGLQELLVEQMEELERFVASGAFHDDRFALLLKKLIGHAYYADPLGGGGQRADAYFNEGIAIASRIELVPTYAAQRREIQWYKVFLLNHRSNLASKRRPMSEQHEEIWADAAIAADLRAIEATLPMSLRSLDGVPRLEECELLVRAAIYWGHRGNQDNFILYKRLERRSLGANWNAIVDGARHFYVVAANYRLLALKIFRAGEFNRYIARHVRQGGVPYVAPWLEEAYSAGSREFETYTSFSQAIGDTAHQYRHHHFVDTLAFVAAQSAEERTRILTDARRAFDAAKLLWGISAATLKPGEVLLKYRLWMGSSFAFEDLLESLAAGRDLQPFEHYLAIMRSSVAEMQMRAKSVYSFSIDEQQRQLEGVYAYASERFR